MKNKELKAAVEHQLSQLRDIESISRRTSFLAQNADDSEEGFLFLNTWLADSLTLIAGVLAREPRRVYGGGLDQPSP